MTLEATRAVVNSIDGIINGVDSAYENLMYGLLLSGLAMQMMGNSRPASGAEHHISHIIEMSPKPLNVSSDALHGEKVGVGTLLAIEEYQRICKSNPTFSDSKEFPASLISEVFGTEMSNEIIAENKKDAASGITKEILLANWQKICTEVSKMPQIDSLKKLYNDFGIKSQLTDIGVQNEKANVLRDFSPMVRNRLTLMRLRKCFEL